MDDNHSIGQAGEPLDEEIAALEVQLAELRARKRGLSRPKSPPSPQTSASPPSPSKRTREVFESDDDKTLPLSLDEYKRYGRQMIMPQVGLQGKETAMEALRPSS
jgi:adenylyltransferase and sulfurtransferase